MVDAIAGGALVLTFGAVVALVPRAALRMLDEDLDTPAVLGLLRELTEAGSPGALPLARHLGLRLGGRS